MALERIAPDQVVEMLDRVLVHIDIVGNNSGDSLLNYACVSRRNASW
jgi:hypothetical protein